MAVDDRTNRDRQQREEAVETLLEEVNEFLSDVDDDTMVPSSADVEKSRDEEKTTSETDEH